MTIKGIQSGAVLQRDLRSDTCHILIECSEDAPLSSNAGTLTKLENGSYAFDGIPVGGPYSITFSANGSEITFTDIYVGDVWLLAGQSNMEGAGILRPQDRPEACALTAVRAYYMDDRWKEAAPDLHQLWMSRDQAHITATKNNLGLTPEKAAELSDSMLENHIRCVGPGFFFGRHMLNRTAIPQGLIPTAIGGAPIELWAPPADGTENYYTAACRRIASCGRNIRGIFWYQGEGFGGKSEDYIQMFESMRQGFAVLCQKENLPCVQAQVFRCTIPSFLRSDESNFSWSRFRAHQIEMDRKLPDLVTVATNDLDLDDCIHLSADAQETLGRRGAEAMIRLTEKGEGNQPRTDSVTIIPDPRSDRVNTVCISFKNTAGALCSCGVPSGFSFSEDDSPADTAGIQRILLSEDRALIRVEFPIDELRRKKLWYGFGHSFYCNIRDGEGRAIPSFGPIELSSAPLEDVE